MRSAYVKDIACQSPKDSTTSSASIPSSDSTKATSSSNQESSKHPCHHEPPSPTSIATESTSEALKKWRSNVARHVHFFETYGDRATIFRKKAVSDTSSVASNHQNPKDCDCVSHDLTGSKKNMRHNAHRIQNEKKGNRSWNSTPREARYSARERQHSGDTGPKGEKQPHNCGSGNQNAEAQVPLSKDRFDRFRKTISNESSFESRGGKFSVCGSEISRASSHVPNIHGSLAVPPDLERDDQGEDLAKRSTFMDTQEEVSVIVDDDGCDSGLGVLSWYCYTNEDMEDTQRTKELKLVNDGQEPLTFHLETMTSSSLFEIRLGEQKEEDLDLVDDRMVTLVPKATCRVYVTFQGGSSINISQPHSGLFGDYLIIRTGPSSQREGHYQNQHQQSLQDQKVYQILMQALVIEAPVIQVDKSALEWNFEERLHSKSVKGMKENDIPPASLPRKVYVRNGGQVPLQISASVENKVIDESLHLKQVGRPEVSSVFGILDHPSYFLRPLSTCEIIVNFYNNQLRTDLPDGVRAEGKLLLEARPNLKDVVNGFPASTYEIPLTVLG